ncbi:hypothetical protein GN956_G8637 [Arapaima gigas]
MRRFCTRGNRFDTEDKDWRTAAGPQNGRLRIFLQASEKAAAKTIRSNQKLVMHNIFLNQTMPVRIVQEMTQGR